MKLKEQPSWVVEYNLIAERRKKRKITLEELRKLYPKEEEVIKGKTK